MTRSFYQNGVPESLQDNVESFIESNKEDFVVWDEYYDETNGTQDLEFFWNYKTDDCIIESQDDKIVGLCCYDVECTRDDLPIDSKPFSYLSLALIDSEYRGQGIGSELLEESIQRCSSESTPIVVCTWESNYRMLNLLHDYGFSIFEVKPNHRHNNQSSVYLKR